MTRQGNSTRAVYGCSKTVVRGVGIARMTCCVFLLLIFVHQSRSDGDEEGAEHGDDEEPKTYVRKWFD